MRWRSARITAGLSPEAGQYGAAVAPSSEGLDAPRSYQVGRNFSADEWRLYFPGEKYRKTFADLPGPDQKRQKTIEVLEVVHPQKSLKITSQNHNFAVPCPAQSM